MPAAEPTPGPSNYAAELRDFLLDLGQLYPAGLQAGVAYWCSMANNGVTCYADMAGRWAQLLRFPRQSDAAISEMIARGKACLRRMGDISEQAVIEFNATYEGMRRRAKTPPAESGPAPSPGPMPDGGAAGLIREVRAATDRVVDLATDVARNLGEQAERGRGAQAAPPPGPGKAPDPAARELVDALTRFKDQLGEMIVRMTRLLEPPTPADPGASGKATR